MEGAIAFFGRCAVMAKKVLTEKPPKVYDPNYFPVSGAIKKFNEVYRKEGLGTAYNKVRMESALRVGTLVGTDGNGNKYYEDLKAPYSAPRPVPYLTHPWVA